MTETAQPLFPFSALLGQDPLRRALLLAAIDTGIGGVLIEGPRGTAKSTSARAIAELLTGPWVTLPLGAAEEQLIGTLNIEAALQGGAVQFAPGLLARAHGGVLYVDEVNLLPDTLVDQLLDVAASGVNRIERDGISHTHPSRFTLIGTMNPEEGELRPQLRDRFGLALALDNCADPLLRREIVKARLSFDANPERFRARFTAQQQQLAQRIKHARARIEQLDFNDAVHDRVSALCIEAGVDGLRADLVMLRAARALAALQGDDTVSTAHVDAVAELALHHRRNTTAPPGENPKTEPDRGSASSGDSQETPQPENPWGEMPPLPVQPLAVKGVKPLPAKKR